MGGRAELVVAEPVKGDFGVVRVDKATMRYVDAKPGDEVDVHGIILNSAQVRAKVEKALAKDEGVGIIRIAADKIREDGFRLGMIVAVERSWLKTLKVALSEKATS